MGKQKVPEYIKEAVDLCKHLYNKHGIRKANCCEIESKKKSSNAKRACPPNASVAIMPSRKKNHKHKTKNYQLVECSRCHCKLLRNHIRKHEAKCIKGNVYNSQIHITNEKCESPPRVNCLPNNSTQSTPTIFTDSTQANNEKSDICSTKVVTFKYPTAV
jgi:hypothetical protein